MPDCRARASPLDDAAKASEVFLRDDLERLFFQHQIGNDFAQPAVFILQRAHLRDFADFHAAELPLSLVEGVRADAVLVAELFGAGTRIVLFDDADDLRVAESGFTQVGLLREAFYASETALSAGGQISIILHCFAAHCAAEDTTRRKVVCSRIASRRTDGSRVSV